MDPLELIVFCLFEGGAGFFKYIMAHRSGDRLIPLASSFELIVGFYMWAPLKV